MFREKITSLILTNLFPLRTNLFSGIFITRRLIEYKKLGVEFSAVSLTLKNKGKLLSFLRHLLHKPLRMPFEGLEGVSFNPVFVERNFFDIVFQKLWVKGKLEDFTDQFAELTVKRLSEQDSSMCIKNCISAYFPLLVLFQRFINGGVVFGE